MLRRFQNTEYLKDKFLKNKDKFLKNRYLKSRHLPPVTGVVLASAFAGSLALAPMDGGSGGSEEPSPVPVPAKAEQEDRQEEGRKEGRKSDRSSARRAVPGPAKPPADCDPSDTSARKYPNGRIPAKALCPLPGKGESLRADAAMAFYKLNEAYYKRFGKNMSVTSSYRSYAKQSRLYRTMPSGMAARPGNSKHGRGIALDLGGGVQRGGSPQFKWLEANSKKFGWIHPAWAYSSPYEPWHWEFAPGRSR